MGNKQTKQTSTTYTIVKNDLCEQIRINKMNQKKNIIKSIEEYFRVQLDDLSLISGAMCSICNGASSNCCSVCKEVFCDQCKTTSIVSSGNKLICKMCNILSNVIELNRNK